MIDKACKGQRNVDGSIIHATAIPTNIMSQKRLRALIADDDPYLREVIASILGMLNVTVVAQASSGSDAIELFETLRPEVVVLDVIMPGLSGLEVLQRIRKQTSSTRVIILTEDDGFEVARQSIALGATCYIRKTNSAQAIYWLLAEYFDRPTDKECRPAPVESLRN